jgi:hypothetical protein
MVARVNGSPLLWPGSLAPQQARRAKDLGGVEAYISAGVRITSEPSSRCDPSHLRRRTLAGLRCLDEPSPPDRPSPVRALGAVDPEGRCRPQRSGGYRNRLRQDRVLHASDSRQLDARERSRHAGPGVRALLLYPTEPKGAEIAMLLRRVRDRVAPLSMLGRIPAVGGLAVARP